AAMFDGTWLDTGDMGYMLDGELVITGRAKDLIIINGRNIWPQDIEWATETVNSVRQGGVAAFSIDDGSGERIVVVAECRGGLSDEQRDGLRRDIAQVIQAAAGAPAEIVLVRPHSMVMTSSGKLSRAKVRQRYLSGDFSGIQSADEASRAAIAK
ncbi:MAG: fatty acyl-AMP ligase, partial [Pseudomonadota bacterium]